MPIQAYVNASKSGTPRRLGPRIVAEQAGQQGAEGALEQVLLWRSPGRLVEHRGEVRVGPEVETGKRVRAGCVLGAGHEADHAGHQGDSLELRGRRGGDGLQETETRVEPS